MDTKTVFISGASRGIGKAAALRFASEGCRLILNCKSSKEELEKLRYYIEETHHVICECAVFDIGDYDLTKRLFSKIENNYGGLDILINNAGISHIGLLTDMKKTEWDALLQTNVTSVFNCCKFAAPSMIRKQNGKIINISSVWGNIGASCEVAYSASKGAVNSFTKALAKELAPSNIQVNAIAFGAIDTEMNHFLSEEERTLLIDEIPAGRIASAEEAADYIYQVAHAPSYLTGQIITFDGGWC